MKKEKQNKLIDIGMALLGAILLYAFLFDIKNIYTSISVILVGILFVTKIILNKY